MKVDAGLVRVQQYPDIRIAFDATSTGAHRHRSEALFGNGRQVIDLPPAAIDPYTVPTVNIDQHLDASNLNMVTCGGQAAIPVVAAVSRIARVRCGEIVASISSRSAGLGTRTNIDEFTQTAAAIKQVGGAERGSAVIVLNPAEPPMRMMRDTVF